MTDTRIEETAAQGMTLTRTGRSMTGLSSNEGSSRVTGHPRKRPTGSSFPSSEQDARSMRIRNIRAQGCPQE